MKSSVKSILLLLAVPAILASCGNNQNPPQSQTPSSQETSSVVSSNPAESSSVVSEVSSVESSSSEALPSSSSEPTSSGVTSEPASSSSSLTIETISVASFRADVEKGASATLKGIVAGFKYNGQGTPYINGFWLADENDSVMVFGEDVAKSVSLGEEVVIKGTKDYYIPQSDGSAASAVNYSGQLELKNIELLAHDGLTHEIPAGAVNEASAATVKETPYSTDISGKLYKTKGYYKVSQGGTASDTYSNYTLMDFDRGASLFAYSNSNGKDFKWSDGYDGKAVELLYAVVLAKPGSTGWRIAPLQVLSEVSLSESEEAGYALTAFKNEIPTHHEAAVSLSLSDKDSLNESIARDVTSADENVTISKEDGRIAIAISANAVGEHELNLSVTLGETILSDKVVITVEKKHEYDTVSIAAAIDSEDGTEVTVEGVVAGIVHKGSANQNLYIADETGSIRVFAGTEYIDALSEVQVGNSVVIKATKTHYVSSSNKDLAASYGYAGDLELTNPTLLWKDSQTHEVPMDAIAEETISGIYNGTCANNISGRLFRVKASVTKGGYNEIYNLVDDKDTNVSIAGYTQGNGSEYSWIASYADGKVHEFLVGVYDNRFSSSTAVKYRVAPFACLD